jgi:hypothetical protein
MTAPEVIIGIGFKESSTYLLGSHIVILLCILKLLGGDLSGEETFMLTGSSIVAFYVDFVGDKDFLLPCFPFLFFMFSRTISCSQIYLISFSKSFFIWTTLFSVGVIQLFT